MTRLQKLKPYLIFFAGSFLFVTFYCFLLQDPVSDFFEDLFDIDDIGYGVIAFIIWLIIYLLWSVIGGILYYKWTHRIIISNLSSFVGCVASLIICSDLENLFDVRLKGFPRHSISWDDWADIIRWSLLFSILPLLVSVITMLLSKLSERNKSEQEKEQEEKKKGGKYDTLTKT